MDVGGSDNSDFIDCRRRSASAPQAVCGTSTLGSRIGTSILRSDAGIQSSDAIVERAREDRKRHPSPAKPDSVEGRR
jgi:hypothetical protein